MLRKDSQFHNKKIEPKKGQRMSLRSNVKSRCPFLSYDFAKENQDNLNRAFDILFEAITSIK